MKAFSIATLIALSALINGSSAFWCGCYKKDANSLLGIYVWQRTDSDVCCRSTTVQGLQKGSWFGSLERDWCIAVDGQADEFSSCCAQHGGQGYCIWTG